MQKSICWQSLDHVFPTLGNQEIHLFSWLPPVSETIEEQFLSYDEKTRASSFYFEKDRLSYTASRIGLRYLLAQYLNTEPSKICFEYNQYGKPFVVPEQNPQRLLFNLSHSGQCVVYGFKWKTNIGVDVEYLKSDVDYEALAKNFFTDNEFKTIQQAEDKQQLFYQLWTCKEAFIKAKGLGLSYPLKNFEVVIAAEQRSNLVQIKNRLDEMDDWFLTSFTPAEGFIGAVAIQAEFEEIRGFRLAEDFYNHRID